MAAAQAGLGRAAELREQRFILPNRSSTFHARDIFAPAAAHLWNGVALDRMGPLTQHIEPLNLPDPIDHDAELLGTVIYVDGYGNLVNNLQRSRIDALHTRFPGRTLLVRIAGGVPIAVSQTYGDVPKGAPLALFGSFEMLEIAVREGNAAETLAAGPGTEIRVCAQP